MNKIFKLLTVTVTAFSIGFAVSNYASSDVPSKIAVIDMAEVLSASSQVKALKKDQEAKMKDIANFLDKARKDVASETDLKKKKALEDKYTKEFNAKKDAQEKAYLDKLAEIDKTLTDTISQAAKSKNYDIVLTKKVVLYGGDDLTEEIKKVVSK